MSCGRPGIRCLASPRVLIGETLSSRSTTDKPWLRFLLISYLRLVLRLLRLFVETLVDRMYRCGIVVEYL